MTPSGQRHIKLSPPTIHQMFRMHTRTLKHSIALSFSQGFLCVCGSSLEKEDTHMYSSTYCTLCCEVLQFSSGFSRSLLDQKFCTVAKWQFSLCVCVCFTVPTYCQDNSARLVVKCSFIYSFSPSILITIRTSV